MSRFDKSFERAIGTREAERLTLCLTVQQETSQRCSSGKHLVQDGEDFLGGGLVYFAQPLHQPRFVDRPDLVQDDLAVLALEPHRDTSGILASSRCHWSNNDGLYVAVHLVGRDDQARAGLANFPTFGRIQAER